MLDQSYYQKADEIIAFYGKKPSSLIPVMQDIQGVYRYLPGELLTYIAKEIGVKEAKAYSVATFYENFSFEQLQSSFQSCQEQQHIRRSCTHIHDHQHLLQLL